MLTRAGVGCVEPANGTADKLGPASSYEGRLRLNIHQISTPIKKSPSTPPTTPPTIGPTFGAEVGAVELEIVPDRELEGLVVAEVVEEDPNGGSMSLPLVAISCASVILNCTLVQSLASCWAHSGICTPSGIGHLDAG